VKGARATLKGAPLVMAPGKIFLAGEYAVLEGGVALVAAVSRYALAQFQPGLTPASTLVAEAIARARTALGEVAAAVPEGSALVSTDTFSLDGVKLGLGSSAAAAVAAAGSLLEYAGVSLAVNRELLFSVADAAHRASQGGLGSGADIASAVYGGFVRFVRLPDSAPVINRVRPPSDLHLVVFWTRTPARTAQLVMEVRTFAERAPEGHAECMAELRAAADAFAEAFGASDARGVVRAADACHLALAALGEAAELPIVTPEVAQAAELARSLGGSAKPSGAGGGDLGVAFFSEARASHTFAARCPQGLLVLDLQLGATGAYRRLPSGIETFNKD
jgi:phosphomevalonate kinase